MNIRKYISPSAGVQWIGFNDGLLRLFGIPIISVIITIVMQRVFKITSGNFLINTIVGMVYTTIYWHFGRALIIEWRSRFPRYEDNKKRLTLILLSLFFSAIFICLVIGFAIRSFLPPEYWHDKQNVFREFLVDFEIGFTVSILVAAYYEIKYAYDRWRKTIAEAEILKTDRVKAQLASLRSQVNPHFLFNSLNALTSLIPSNPDQAVEYVHRLSDVYRYILKFGGKEIITLREELDFVDSFIHLLKGRFGANFVVTTEIDDKWYNWLVIPTSVQMLLENAVKHNEISTRKPLHINLTVNEHGVLIVSNPIKLKSLNREISGVGLENITRRYELLSGNELNVYEKNNNFIVEFKLIQHIDYEGSYSRG